MIERPKEEELTGPGTIGSPRPGEERMQRVLSPSSSDVRREKQVLDQACSSHAATDPPENRERRHRAGAALSGGSSDDSSPVKRRKWTFSPPSLSTSEAEMCSDGGGEAWRKTGKSSSSPRSTGSKGLLSMKVRLIEARNMPSATLIDNLVEVADTLDEMANSANELKSAFVRRLRDSARRTRANAIELAKRMDTAAAMAAVTQEVTQLRAKLLKADQEIGSLKMLQLEKVSTGSDALPKMPPTFHRAEPVADPETGKLVGSNATEIRALVEQDKVLSESELAGAKDDRPIGQTETARPESADPEMEMTSNESEGKTEVRKQAMLKSARNQQGAEPLGRPMPNAAVSDATADASTGRR